MTKNVLTRVFCYAFPLVFDVVSAMQGAVQCMLIHRTEPISNGNVVLFIPIQRIFNLASSLNLNAKV